MDFNFEEINNIKIEKNVDNTIKSNDNLILKKKKLIEISKNLTKI
jgi:hypothetical protein